MDGPHLSEVGESTVDEALVEAIQTFELTLMLQLLHADA